MLSAKIAFGAIADAFAHGDKAALKGVVSQKLYNALCSAIDKRNELEQTMEFSLIGISSSKILSKNDDKKPTVITVELVTEQMNVLRDKDGNILEGDAIQIAKIKDTWTFKKENKLRSGWVVCTTKSEAA